MEGGEPAHQHGDVGVDQARLQRATAEHPAEVEQVGQGSLSRVTLHTSRSRTRRLPLRRAVNTSPEACGVEPGL